jgi:lipopolysaccharide export system protein LptA
MRASIPVISLALLLAALADARKALPQAVDAAPIAEATRQGQDVGIEADSMEVLDKQRKAIFTGNVNAARGGVTLKSNRLVVDYRSGKGNNNKKSEAKGGSATEVTNLEATGSVVIITRTQKITGDKALIDVKANRLTVEGNVVVEQGTSVVKGNQLVVDLATNRSQMTGGRVKGLFTPSQKTP